MYSLSKIERFNQYVLSKYQIYNSVFFTLPFEEVKNTGVLLSLFSEICNKGYENHWSPKKIMDDFCDQFLKNYNEEEIIDLLFKMIQFVERQIVLFDAVEEAGFSNVNNLDGKGSLRDLKETSESNDKIENFQNLLREFKIRVVLTAHPTQFYPDSILGIITDLIDAIKSNDLMRIKELLAQLGKTPFVKKEKPTPLDEAVSIIWYLENVLYPTMGMMRQYIHKNILQVDNIRNPIIEIGFWPGGDRDGNPFVTPQITLEVANRLKSSILKLYYYDLKSLERKLTFIKVSSLITSLCDELYEYVFCNVQLLKITLEELKSRILEIRDIIIKEHQSLYLEDIDLVLHKINLFGFYFVSLDIRENSKIFSKVFKEVINNLMIDKDIKEKYFLMNENEKIEILNSISGKIDINCFKDEMTLKTLETINLINIIQENNGVNACSRIIISNCESASAVLEVFTMYNLCHNKSYNIDIVPLFETVNDLNNAHLIMEKLYLNNNYFNHLRKRDYKQTIMVGFSDGTKDGGYLMANWSIYKAKQEISEMSRKYGVKVVFFDGRGGPPARGGGKTHKFYASLGSKIENHEIQLTIQGQTISSNFGTKESCKLNLENLLTAGISNHLFFRNETDLNTEDENLLNEISEIGYNKYLEFKNHPKFIPYLEKMSTLKYYSLTNIGSRPSKRGKSESLNFDDLRAIPFVGSWSQLKQNVPGFFGVGTALLNFEINNRWDEIKSLYDKSLFFRTLLENSMMSITKSFFPLTSYMKNDEEFGEFWNIIYEEYLLSKRLLLKISGHKELMENYPDGKASITIREEIVKPLLTIQQYALFRINEINSSGEKNDALLKKYEKLVIRSLFGNTNASRNSA